MNDWQTNSESPERTEALAEKIGHNLKGGEVIELISDLGGGKTTFVRGLARGFGTTDRVASPTFTISKVYTQGERAIHHFDFYRLDQAGLMDHELADVLSDSRDTTVIEWGEVVSHILPKDRLSISFKKVDDEQRLITFAYPESLAYLMAGVI